MSFVREVNRSPADSLHKGPLMRKRYHTLTSPCDGSDNLGTESVSGARPTNDISIEFEIRSELGAL